MKETVNLKVASKTHNGYIRERNEDALFVASNKRAFAIADGMGGLDAGDLASRLAVQAVQQLWKSAPPSLSYPDEIRTWIAQAIGNANGKIVRESFNLGLDMGTTLVVAVQAKNGLLCYGHLGDSRLYSSRQGCLTVDHAIGPHELTNFAGCSLSSTPDLASTLCEPGTRILICTDGLNKVVADEEIMEVMLNAHNPDNLLEILMDLALGYGGPDNITMIGLHYL